jgi:hypothetical protein
MVDLALDIRSEGGETWKPQLIEIANAMAGEKISSSSMETSCRFVSAPAGMIAARR